MDITDYEEMEKTAQALLAEYDDKVKQLKADLAKAEALSPPNKQDWPSFLKQATQAFKDLVDLKADLAKFGGHTAECAFTRFKDLVYQDDYGRTPPGMSDKCDCGWAEIEEKLNA